jgi:flagellar FliJ protein
MASFKYRLERVLNLREQELEKVKIKFQEAAAKVAEIKRKIADNKKDQLQTQKTLMTKEGLASPILYTNRLKHLKKMKEDLEEHLVKAKEELRQAQEELVEAQQKAEILKRHKDKKREEYDKEELRKEEIQLNEMGLIIKRLRDEEEKEYQSKADLQANE